MVYRRVRVLLIPLAVSCGMLPAEVGCQQHAERSVVGGSGTQSAHAATAQVTNVPIAGLQSTISVNLDAVPFAQALQAIARQAAVPISITDGATRVAKHVTLRAKEMRAVDAFRMVLAGTKVRMTVANDGQVLFSLPPSATQQAQGSVSGRVTDAATKRPVAGATVSIASLKRSARTNDSGYYALPSLPVGAYKMTVRLIGFSAADRAITVRANDTLVINVGLSSVPQRLQEVVTIGSGYRRRLEVGNSIATINADSIVPHTPIRNLSDLLKGRAPGVQVLSTSGSVGSGSRIRIRGVSSILSDADPIVIVNGIRVDAAYSQSATDPTKSPATNQAGYSSGVPAMSRLDDIDFENIEKVEVLRGPSAATLYGSDAANGVIVITTKRGHAGPPRWSAFAQRSTSRMHAVFPDSYRAWGESLLDPSSSQCLVASQAHGLCTIDSVTHFNPLNHRETSPFARGRSDQYGGQVSGGAAQLQYFLGANYNDDVGMLKLPAADIANMAIYRNGAPLPDWAIRPNILKGFHVTSKLTTQGSNADLAFSSDVTRQYHRDSRADFITYSYDGPGFRDPVTNGWGTFTPARFFMAKTSDQITRGFGGINGSWRPFSTLAGRATLGADYANRVDEWLQRKGDQPFDPSGYRARSDQTTLVRTADVGATHDVALGGGLRLRSSVGGQYTRNDIEGVNATGQGIPDGVDILNNATTRDVSEVRSAKATAGWFTEETLVLHDRLFLIGAVRGDAGSGFGADAKPVLYPKWSASWLLSQEPFFPRLVGLNNVRLRAAFGHAGVQPTIDARFRSFRSTNGFVGGPTPALGMSTVGNPLLLPERSVEVEGGIDIGLWDDRATVEATMYHKTTRNALVERPLPPSLGIATRQENIGKVDNRGLEISATLRPVMTPLVDWNMTLGFSQNRNKLVTLGPATLPHNDYYQGGSARYVPGYPLNGFWDRAILAVADTNGNGVIEYGEYELSDSAVYMGQPFPKAELSFFNDLAFHSGLIRIGSAFTYTGGLTQRNSAALHQCDFSASGCRAANDPTASFAEQAIYQAATVNVYTYSAHGYYERVSWLRLNELSVTLAIPTALAQRVRARSASIAVMGRNFGMWSSYRGPDPEVNTDNIGNRIEDGGGVPQPREWSFRINLGY